jgi:hypothetical protein
MEGTTGKRQEHQEAIVTVLMDTKEPDNERCKQDGLRRSLLADKWTILELIVAVAALPGAIQKRGVGGNDVLFPLHLMVMKRWIIGNIAKTANAKTILIA